ncbi:MAG: hypothetical protein K9K67_11610 [Bacteriovoracaceae bacterium]|nr:hypothetical protein [Bacteriovoracaceae bacterium]
MFIITLRHTLIVLLVALFFGEVMAEKHQISDSSDPVLRHFVESATEGNHSYELELIELKEKQIILFKGGFGYPSFKPAKKFLTYIKEGKDIHFYIGRGLGGSVREHKKFILSVMEKCKDGKTKTCQVTTYLDGQCSSMCTTLFLYGDKRIARDDLSANLGFHRTTMVIRGRHFPIQSPSRMARYFSRFDINQDYLKENKDIIFGVPNNGFHRMSGIELIESGFTQELSPLLEGSVYSFLRSFHGIQID